MILDGYPRKTAVTRAHTSTEALQKYIEAIGASDAIRRKCRGRQPML